MVVVVFGANSAQALDPRKTIFQFNCQNWTRQNGLPSDKVSSVTQTKDGYLWLGTQNGLVRFDGTEFKVFPIALREAQGLDVGKVVPAREGGLWFAIDRGGFGHFDGRQFTPVADSRWSAPNMSGTSIVQARDGSLWTGSLIGPARWVPGNAAESFHTKTTTNVLTLFEDQAGRIWMGTAERGLNYWANGEFVPFPAESLKRYNIYALAVDRDGSVWVGTGNGLYCFDPSGQPRPGPAVPAQVNALHLDSHGVLWIGTARLGLGRYHDGSLTFLTRTDALGSDFVTALCEDAEGSLWIGTQDGLSQLSDLKFPIYSDKEGLSGGGGHSVTPSRRGGLWVTSTFGLSYFDGRVGSDLTSRLVLADEKMPPNAYIKVGFEARNGDVYFVDGEKNIGLMADGRLVARYPQPTWADALAEDDTGLLVSQGATLCRMRDGVLEPFVYRDGRQPVYSWINNLCVTKDGTIWLATNAGIFRVRNGEYRRWSAWYDGLSADRVHCIIEDADGTIWAGLPTGLVRMKGDQHVNITADHGLHDTRVYAVVPDDHGYFWISSGRGLFRVARQALNDVADGKAAQVACDVFEGRESVKFLDRTDQGYSGCKTADGRIWFPNAQGVVMIDPRRYVTNQVPPLVHIEEVRVDHQPLDPRRTAVFGSGCERVEFTFAALSFISPKRVRVQYQLEGFDRTWIESGSRRAADYTKLPPGRYRFKVRAANADGVWNPTEAEYRFELPPPFHQTFWFYGLCGVVSLFALIGGHRWRIRHMEALQRKLKAENDQLEAKVVERTAELAHERDLLRTLLDSSPDHIYFKDAQSRIVKCCRAFAQRVGAHSPDELMGKTDFDLFSEDHARSALADEQEIIRSGEPLLAKVEKEIRPNGEVTWALTTKMPWRARDGTIVGTFGLSKDITTLKESEAKLVDLHKALIETSRQAGMAEVATSVLHNVGNVLNSVNVSTTLVTEHVRDMRVSHLGRVSAMLQEHAADLAEFLRGDPKGQKLPEFVAALTAQLGDEQQWILAELGRLGRNIDHIKEIVAMQQSYAHVAGVTVTVELVEIVEDALLINAQTGSVGPVEIVRDYRARPVLTIDRHKVLQILVNLVRNAHEACRDGGRSDARIKIVIAADTESVRVSIIDNGVGIEPELLSRIFAYGFTTKKDGHGFALHSASLGAKDLGGNLTAHSDGPGAGATFTLELPVSPARPT